MTHRQIVDLWNAAYQVGQRVRYEPVKGKGGWVETTTSSLAWVLGTHTPVVMIDAKSGCVALDHLEAVTDVLKGAKESP
jgi:hypothetical protein